MKLEYSRKENIPGVVVRSEEGEVLVIPYEVPTQSVS